MCVCVCVCKGILKNVIRGETVKTCSCPVARGQGRNFILYLSYYLF